MKTIRRDWLKRQIEAGRMEAKCDYHYTDDYKWDAATDFGKTGWLQARIRHPKFAPIPDKPWADYCADSDFIEGQMNFHPCEFEGNCGRAYWEDEAHTLIALHVHSNLSYTLRLKAEVKQ